MTTSAPSAIRPRERDALLQSLRAGVVPRIGPAARPGRTRQRSQGIARRDIDGSTTAAPAAGSSSASTAPARRSSCTSSAPSPSQQKLVTVHADLSPDRRLHATGGQARSLYAELMRNMATRAKPDGGAMASVVERFVTQALSRVPRHAAKPVEGIIRRNLDELSELTGGYDFAEVIAKYWQGHDSGNEQLKSDAVRWLRGEFTTRTDARTPWASGPSSTTPTSTTSSSSWPDSSGWPASAGILVCLDEMVNLYKLANSQARNSNYEQILRILNDSPAGNRRQVWGSSSAAHPISCSIPAAASTHTLPCSRAWPRTASPSTDSWTTPDRCCAWPA